MLANEVASTFLEREGSLPSQGRGRLTSTGGVGTSPRAYSAADPVERERSRFGLLRRVIVLYQRDIFPVYLTDQFGDADVRRYKALYSP